MCPQLAPMGTCLVWVRRNLHEYCIYVYIRIFFFKRSNNTKGNFLCREFIIMYKDHSDVYQKAYNKLLLNDTCQIYMYRSMHGKTQNFDSSVFYKGSRVQLHAHPQVKLCMQT